MHRPVPVTADVQIVRCIALAWADYTFREKKEEYLTGCLDEDSTLNHKVSQVSGWQNLTQPGDLLLINPHQREMQSIHTCLLVMDQEPKALKSCMTLQVTATTMMPQLPDPMPAIPIPKQRQKKIKNKKISHRYDAHARIPRGKEDEAGRSQVWGQFATQWDSIQRKE